MVRVLWADAVVTGDGPDLADGAVVLDARGEIVELGAAQAILPQYPGVPCERIHGVLLPGLVNAHTHLELSALRGHVPGGAGFVPWVERLIGARTEMMQEDAEIAIDRAVAELDAGGTALVGEVTNSLAAVPALVRAGLGGRIFHEVFGIAREAVLHRTEALLADVEAALGRFGTGHGELEYALAPHALYTTHPDAIRAIVDATRTRGERTSIHLAEHPAERRALEHGDGPVTTWLAARVKIPVSEQVWPHRGPIEEAARLGVLSPHVLLVHLTDARHEELETIAASGARVVLCPRSNLFIESRLPPLLALRHAGIRPALGTDSLASNVSLDVLAEARALADRFPDVPPTELVAMATWNGAQALGVADAGRIAKGARPGIVAIEGDVRGLSASAFVLRQVKAPRRWVVRRRAA